jgi:hypothetical protein
MDDGKHDNLIWHQVKVDRVRKASHKCAARLALDARVCERGLGNTSKRLVYLRRKGFAKASTLFLVPVTGVE